jgi:hypothetical protein
MKFSRRDRPRRRAAEQRDELVPFPLIDLHPIGTSSRRRRTGTVAMSFCSG